MKRFVITISCLLAALLLAFGGYYAAGLHLKTGARGEVSCAVRTQDGRILRSTQAGWQEFEIRGVDLGSGLPGAWATDYAVDEETYLRWFEQIGALGANVIRVRSVQSPGFYRALHDFNAQAESPLYLLQGIRADEYAQNSHMDAFDPAFCDALKEDCRTAVDALHGKRLRWTNDAGSAAGFFRCDVSQWVLGYVIGEEWVDVTVAYTDEKYPDLEGYEGAYLRTAEGASPFEIMLAQVGDELIRYESERYGQQRLVSFAGTRTTDPFDYPAQTAEFFRKCASIDTEHILAADGFTAGLFASYSVYPYDLDYLSVMEPAQWSALAGGAVELSDCDGTRGVTDTYLAYLKLLNAHHDMPVVVSFGAASGRGLAQLSSGTGLREGHLSEQEQGRALVSALESIAAAGSAGAIVSTWQDEWNRRTWNTMFAVDMSRSPYWSDAQSNDQHFGLLAFDPGKESVCTVDGDASEWSADDVTASYAGGMRLSVKYDERYLYLLAEKPGYVFGEETLYLPIDTTQKTGAAACAEEDVTFDRAVDFLVKLAGEDDSLVLVQDRYHAIHANYEAEITGRDAYIDPPARDSTHFEPVQMATKDTVGQFWSRPATLGSFETGRLRRGNADPSAADYDSLTDFAVGDGVVELRLPWGLLNFSDPSRLQIHDDYYDGNYGVEFITLKKLYVGLGTGEARIALASFTLRGWGNDVTWHERLKPAYYAVQARWTGGEAA